MPEKENVPAIRFKGYTDDWEQRKLSELGKTQSGIGFSESEQGGSDGFPFFKVSDMNNLGNEHEMKIANNYVSFEQLQRRNWKPIEGVPCVIFAKVGAAIMLDRKRIVRIPFLIDNNTMAYIFDGSWDVDFGRTLFETIPLPRYAQVGALPSYNGSDIEDIEVCVPTKEEQTKIAELFVSLDNLITLHQRKLLKLKNVKKAMLEKMFPKNGSNFPEIRFAGFTDAWEQRTLGELLTVHSFKPYLAAPQIGGKYEVIQQGDHPIAGYANGNPFQTYEDIILFGDHTMSLYKAKSPFFVVSDGLKILSSQELKGHFLLSLLERFKPVSEGYKRHYSILKEVEVLYPKKTDEQKQIGTYFEHLDNLITLHQRKYEKLQNLKKACLEKMFVR